MKIGNVNVTTPLIIIAILILPYTLLHIVERGSGNTAINPFKGALGLSLAFAFFGLGHFIKTNEMTQMLPPFVPMKEILVYLTGIIEFIIAAMLLFPKTRYMAGIFAIAALVLFFPANVYAAINYTGMGGHSWGPVYLLIRLPLQIILISWAYFFIVRPYRQAAF